MSLDMAEVYFWMDFNANLCAIEPYHWGDQLSDIFLMLNSDVPPPPLFFHGNTGDELALESIGEQGFPGYTVSA